MANKKKPTHAPKPASDYTPTTLKDLLSGEILDQLKAQADEMKAEEQKKKEAEQLRIVEARQAEQKKLDNNFEHLLENSSQDWRKFK
ncbi:L-lactate utilization protein LutC [Paenibacillus sp. DS2015]|uniref:YqkE family protein n=1 Tax=Paenibacillus sp. DS2015 TaxID=3373917 RepID=UPI003D1B349C